MSRRWVCLLSVPMIAATLFAAACGGDDDNGTSTTPDGGGGGDGPTGDTSTTDDTGTTVKPDTGPPETLTFTTFANFSVGAGQLPEGVVVLNGTPIVTWAPLGQLMKVL